MNIEQYNQSIVCHSDGHCHTVDSVVLERMVDTFLHGFALALLAVATALALMAIGRAIWRSTDRRYDDLDDQLERLTDAIEIGDRAAMLRKRIANKRWDERPEAAPTHDDAREARPEAAPTHDPFAD